MKSLIKKILKEETSIPLVIRRRASFEDIEEAFDYALERMGGSMNNPDSIIYKKKGTTLRVFAKFVIDEMVTYLEQDYFNDDSRIYFENDDYYYNEIRNPLIKYYSKRIKEKFDEVKTDELNESLLKEETGSDLKHLAKEDIIFAIRIAGGFENIIKTTKPTEEEIDEMITNYLNQVLYPDYDWVPELYQDELERWGIVDFFVNDEILYCYYLDDDEREPHTLQLEKDISNRLYELFDDKWINPFIKWFENNTGLKVKVLSIFDDDYNQNNIRINESASKKETNFKKTLQSSIERFGYFEVSKLIGGFDDLCDILDLDLDDIDTQEMLVKDFIYFADIDEIEVDSIEVKNRANRKLINVHIQTDSNARNIDSWYVRTIVDDMNNFFPFKVDVSWHPVNYPHSKIMIDASIGGSVPFDYEI